MTTPALSAAIIAMQAAVDPVVKEGWDKHGQRPFARHEDMIRYGREHLTAHGIALVPMGTSYQHLGEFGPKAKAHGIVTIRWKLVHKSGEEMSIERQMIAVSHDGMALDKAVAAAQSYDLIYAYRDVLQVDRRMPGEVPVDERPDAPAFEPRQRAEQRGWGQAAVERAFGAQESAPAPPVQQIAPNMPVESAGVSTPFDAPDPDVVFAGFLESVRMARPDTIDAVWNSIDKCPEAELRADDYETLRVAVRQRKIDFCRTEADFAECVRAIQKARFTGESLVKLKAYHEARKAEVLAAADRDIPY